MSRRRRATYVAKHPVATPLHIATVITGLTLIAWCVGLLLMTEVIS